MEHHRGFFFVCLRLRHGRIAQPTWREKNFPAAEQFAVAGEATKMKLSRLLLQLCIISIMSACTALPESVSGELVPTEMLPTVIAQTLEAQGLGDEEVHSSETPSDSKTVEPAQKTRTPPTTPPTIRASTTPTQPAENTTPPQPSLTPLEPTDTLDISALATKSASIAKFTGLENDPRWSPRYKSSPDRLLEWVRSFGLIFTGKMVACWRDSSKHITTSPGM